MGGDTKEFDSLEEEDEQLISEEFDWVVFLNDDSEEMDISSSSSCAWIMLSSRW